MRYHSKSNVIFGGISLSDYNAFSFGCSILNKPDRDITSVSVPGRDGDLTFDNGRYKNVIRSYQIQVVGTDNIHNLESALIEKVGYQRLEDEYDPEMYMIARMSNAPSVSSWVGEAASIRLTFDRKPQRFYKSGEKAISFTANGSIRNTTIHSAKPLVRVYGTGTVSIGEKSIQILSVNQYVDIDCELQDAYKEGANCNNNIRLLSGDFFSLEPGANGVQISGSVSKVEITPRWWTI